MVFSPPWTRRSLIASVAALALAGCGRGKAPEPAAQPAVAPTAPPPKPGSLEWAVAGPWRGENAQRDRWRHPLQTLQFFGLAPGMRVVEMWPGTGWYTEILAPFLASSMGKLYAASFQPAPGDSAAAAVVATYEQMFSQRKDLYGEIVFDAFGPTSGPLAPAGGADLVLFMETLHGWLAAGLAEKAFRDAFAALKPGGVLGVEAHRAPPGGLQDPLAGSGYVQEAFVRQLATEAGFVFDKASEINANPADTHDHPFGVATLAPERRSSPAGKPADAGFDHRRFDAIGESDRMTLRFVKPG